MKLTKFILAFVVKCLFFLALTPIMAIGILFVIPYFPFYDFGSWKKQRAGFDREGFRTWIWM